MRPKKRILLIDSDEYRASTMSFMLRTNGYAVSAAANEAEGKTLFGEAVHDAVVAAVGFPELEDLLAHFRWRNDSAPHMVLASKPDQNHVACDCFVVNAPAEEILQRLKVLCARKRGPKKGVRRVEAKEVIAAQRIA